MRALPGSHQVVAEVSIDGRRYRGHGTFVRGDHPVVVLTLTDPPRRPSPLIGADVTDLAPEVSAHA